MTDRYEKIRKALEMAPTPGPWEAINGTDVFTPLGARNAADAYSDFLAELPPSSAWLLRKQAEAVEALAEKIRNDVQGTNTLWKMLTAIDVEAQELRKKAEVAERVGGEKEESDDE